MFAITKLSPETQEFLNYIASGNRNRSRLTSIVIGRALANTLNLPSCAVEDLQAFYRTNVLIGVQSRVSELNELTLIDVDAVLDFTYRFFVFRYYAAYPKRTMFCHKPETAVSDFLGASFVLDEGTLAEIQAAPVDVTKLFNSFVQFFEELSQ